ncbi:hypothetical protein GCM10018785_57950 [Streptomyces longispororuber]|uniref:Uncharacterized protein n=1 Tax=Streptomyces longispororuber TaxID=68230 RepID=A0A919DT82_9ACTN|nr:hypothetical protein GCM10018785_57950 [Streptomyces longispororuber]
MLTTVATHMPRISCPWRLERSRAAASPAVASPAATDAAATVKARRDICLMSPSPVPGNPGQALAVRGQHARPGPPRTATRGVTFTGEAGTGTVRGDLPPL